MKRLVAVQLSGQFPQKFLQTGAPRLQLTHRELSRLVSMFEALWGDGQNHFILLFDSNVGKVLTSGLFQRHVAVSSPTCGTELTFVQLVQRTSAVSSC